MGFKIFKIPISDYVGAITHLIDNLNTEEKRRSVLYHFEADRNRFIISRSFLRILLAEEIGINALEIKIEKDSFEKPFLPSHPNTYFNVSHSGDFALIILGSKMVGIDVEKMDLNQDFSDIIPSVFCTKEINELQDSSDKTRTFYKFWTRKEAILKAIGKGISEELKRLCVTDAYHNIQEDILPKTTKLFTFSFEVDENHIGALCCEGDYHKSAGPIYFSALPEF